MSKKFYWLKLKNNFFEQDSIRLIESMENGKDYIIFLLKLKLKSIEKEGYLKYNDSIPYDEKMLATLTFTNIDIVRTAIKIFIDLNLIEILEDGTIYLNCVQDLIGKETDIAQRVRSHRERKLLQCNIIETKCNIELEKDIEKDIESNTTIINEIYNLYPNRDINNNNRSTNKSNKDKIKISKLLKNIDKEEIKERILFYLKECNRTKTYISNFTTLLNNLPEIPKEEISAEPELRKVDISEYNS